MFKVNNTNIVICYVIILVILVFQNIIMSKMTSSRFSGFLGGQTFGNLRIATLAIAVLVFLSLTLFQFPSLAPMDVFIFDNRVGMDGNVFFSYFLDFSHIFSSIFIVCIFVLTVMLTLVLVNYYLNTGSFFWVFCLGAVYFFFYLSVSIGSPYIERIEDKFLSSSPISQSLYFGDYETAYGDIGLLKASSLDRAYLNTQVSLDAYLHDESVERLDLLNADARALNFELEVDPKLVGLLDDSTIYQIYDKSTIKAELNQLKPTVDSIHKKTFMYAVIFILVLAIAVYNLVVYRKKAGL